MRAVKRAPLPSTTPCTVQVSADTSFLLSLSHPRQEKGKKKTSI